MKLLQIYIIIAILLLGTGLTGHAGQLNREFETRHVGKDDGLGSQRVFAIAEDERGAMWIATKSGIDRFNGRTVKNYVLPGSFYYGDLAGRKLGLLYSRRQGLWAYDNTGRIYRYSPEHDKFEQRMDAAELIGENVVLNKLVFDDRETLWMAADRGLYGLTKEGGMTAVMEDVYASDLDFSDSCLFVATDVGVWQLKRDNPADRRLRMEGRQVQTVHWDERDGELWVGTLNSGLLVTDGRRMKTVGPEVEKLRNPIRAITAYDDSTLLVGIDGGGVYAVDKKEKTLGLLIDSNDDSDAYLQGNGVYAVVKDRWGNVWIGSYTGGVTLMIAQDYRIETWKHERGNNYSLPDNNVNDIEENNDGMLWIATDNGIGICLPEGSRWTNVLSGVIAVSLDRDGRGNVWVGTYGKGVYLLDAKGSVVRHFTRQSGELATNYVLYVKQDIGGDLWVGGLNGELAMVKGRDGTGRTFAGVKWVQAVETVTDGVVAVATVNGFCLIDKRTGKTDWFATAGEFRDKNVSAYVVSILPEEDGKKVWLGTEGGGLNLYDLSTREVSNITMEDGLPSNDVYSLQRDGRGRLWISTGAGLALLEDGKVANINYLGRIDKEYNKNACAALSDGRFAYGSTEGLVLLKPEEISAADYEGTVRFTDMEPDLRGSRGERLATAMRQGLAAGRVVLKHDQNSFTLMFESINYRFQRDIVYRYKLEGYDESWSGIEETGRARYAKVSPGRYRFGVMSLRNSDGRMLDERWLEIVVRQPWWNTVWAWCAYVGLAGVLLGFVFRYKANVLQKRYNEDKIRFFVNTAHDIRTPVSLVMAPLEDLQKEVNLPADIRYKLNLAEESAGRLYGLITQLLEFEKLDTRGRKFRPVPVDLTDVLRKEVAEFREVGARKGIAWDGWLPEESVYVPANRQLLELLFDNLLANACKYTLKGGKVTVSLKTVSRKVVVTVGDTGIGIPRQARRHIFTEVYRAENALYSEDGGTGFGLLQVHRIVKMLRGKISYRSEEGVGTVFTVVLPRMERAADSMADEDVKTTPKVSGHPDTDWQEGGMEGASVTLLIVEDDDALRGYLRQTFGTMYRVVDVADGQAALAYLEREYPDLILSDLCMPGIGGDELCRRIKQNPDTAGIPFVLLTAKSSHESMVEGLKQGADDYLLKPFSTEILKLKMQGLIDNRNRMRDSLLRHAIARVKEESGKEEVTQPEEEAPKENLPEDGWNAADRDFVLRATQTVMDHMAELDFSINLLCREMAMSRTLFYSRLKSLTGKGPQEFVRIIRLQKAAELLSAGMTVSEVALETGFVNTKYFSSLFKKQFGVQPSKYGEGCAKTSD